MFSAVGAAFSLLFDFITYVCSSILVLINVRTNWKQLAQYDKQERALAQEAEQKAESQSTDFWGGIRFVRHNGVIRSIAFSAGQFNFFTAAFFTVYYVFVVRELHMSAAAIGFAATCSGVAGIASAAMTSPLMKRMHAGPLFIVSLFLPAVAAVLVPISIVTVQISEILVIALVCLSQFAWSFTVTVNIILSESIKQVATPEHLLGQVSSVERVIALAAEPIGALAGGFIADSIGESPTLYICVIGLALSTVWAFGSRGILSFKQPKEWAVA